MTYQASGNRYDIMPFRRCGVSGLKLPAISLGLWHNFAVGKTRKAAALLNSTGVRALIFTGDELKAIDQHAVEGGINLWQRPSTDQRP